MRRIIRVERIRIRKRTKKCKREYLGGNIIILRGCTPSESGCTRITCLKLKIIDYSQIRASLL